MKRIAIALAALALTAPAWGVKPKDTGVKSVKNGKVTERPVDKGFASINEMTARGHIGFLAADELEGREAGYNSGRIAGKRVFKLKASRSLHTVIADKTVYRGLR